MTFALATHWVWDLWLADDGERYHLYYLHAPRSLGDEQLRHRHARIGHATSTDLTHWSDHGEVLGPGEPGAFDASATWTGSVVRGDDGLWRMFYTGSRFLTADAGTNIETIGVATSTDLHHWVKAPGPVAAADPRWYETLADGTWREEAWRDPWVQRGADGRWHMLVTARARTGDGADRGVVGHAVSDDLEQWEVLPPLSEPGGGFAHLEVPQLIDVDGERILLLSCSTSDLTGARAGEVGGIYSVGLGPSGAGPDGFDEPYPIADAVRLVDDSLYAGRIIQDRAGQAVLLAFANGGAHGAFGGAITDPIPVAWNRRIGALRLIDESSAA